MKVPVLLRTWPSESDLQLAKGLTSILAGLVGGLTLGRTRVGVLTAQLSNTLHSSAKLDYQGTGFRFAKALHLKLLNMNLRPDGQSGHRDIVWNAECSVSNDNERLAQAAAATANRVAIRK